MTKILPCTYRTQRDNKNDPFGTCNVTSMVMMLESSGLPLPAKSGQPEDALAEILLSEDAYDEMRRKYIWAWNKSAQAFIVKPYEVHGMLDWAVGQWYGRMMTGFMADMKVGSMVNEIDRGCALTLSGIFTMNGHMVCLIGYSKDDKTGELQDLILNDPYGDWKTKYKNTNGEKMRLSALEAKGVLRAPGIDQKWAHYILPQMDNGARGEIP